MTLIAELRRRLLTIRQSSWPVAVLASAMMIAGGIAIFTRAPAISLLVFIAAQAAGYFAPRKRFIVLNLTASFLALFLGGALTPGAVTGSEFALTAVSMGVVAYLVHTLRVTEDQLDDARWRAEIATEAADIGIFKWDFDTDLVTSNDALRKIFDLPEAGPIYGQDIFARIAPEDVPATRSAVDRVINDQGTYEAEFRVRGPDGGGRVKWIEGRGDIVKDRRTGRRSLTGVNIDVTARKEQDEYVGKLLEGVGAALGITDAAGRILHLNSFAAEVFGAEGGNSPGGYFWELPSLEGDAEAVRRFFAPRAGRDAAAGAEDAPVEIAVRNGDHDRVLLLSVSPVGGARGVVNFIPYAVDITERKDAELQNELLVAELNHRSKNLFSVVNALITLSARHASSVEEFASSTISRLGALHDAHNLGAADLRRRGAKLFDIFETTLAPWRTDAPRIFISGDDQFLDAGQATSWALIAHELTTNANKYGALAHGGEVRVEMKGSPRAWTFVWRESGLDKPVEDTGKKGFGQTVIKRLSATYLDAEVDFDLDKDGLTVTIASRSAAGD